jgi:hypothetical protein
MELLSSDDLQAKIEARLKSAINDIEVGQVDEALVYANPGGLTLLNDLDDLKTRMTRNERERASSNGESAIMKKELGFYFYFYFFLIIKCMQSKNYDTV